MKKELVEQVAYELIGEDVFPMLHVLLGKSNISEFQIATATKLPVDVTRNQLYRLYNHNLVTFNRKKDKQKGWYIYYWTLNLERFEYLVTDLKRKKIERLENRIQREQENTYFTSESRCVRVDFEQATELGFKCPESGELLHQEDNSQIILKLKKEIEQLQIEIEKEEEKERLKAEKEEKKIAEKEEKESKKVTKKTVKKAKVAKKTTKKTVKKVTKKATKKKAKK